MQLWVDYTNHKGKRAWRRIGQPSACSVTTYPPYEVETAERHKMLPCIKVYMFDRDANRTLSLTSIHGFRFLADDVTPFDPGGIETDEVTRLRRERIGDNEKINALMSENERLKSQLADRNALGEMAGVILDMPKAITTTWEKIDRLAELVLNPGGIEPVPVADDFLTQLRYANAERQIEWQVGKNISVLYRATELGGEVGELLNMIKKVERSKLGLKGSRASQHDIVIEFGDVLICLDLLATMMMVDLRDAATKAFNAKSQEHGFKARLVE